MKGMLIAGLLVVLAGGSGFAQQDSLALDSLALRKGHATVENEFNRIVEKFADFFQTKQKLLYKYEHDKGASGYAAYGIEYTCKKVTSLVRGTSSDQITYTATLTLLLSKRTNRACGSTPDVTALGLPAGWDEEEEALANMDRETCYMKNRKAVQSEVDVNFKYVDGKWIFKDAVNAITGELETAISAALGKYLPPAMPIKNPAAQEFNRHWLALVQ